MKLPDVNYDPIIVRKLTLTSVPSVGIKSSYIKLPVFLTLDSGEYTLLRLPICKKYIMKQQFAYFIQLYEYVKINSVLTFFFVCQYIIIY